ncbi:MAG: hypothetical protein OXE49_22105 [Gemmatimonadetes bacterium]|nr:hypothetical protein [Gemmatimonadota bacterium]
MSDISFEHVLSSQYTVFDGLAGMHIEDIYQDRQGFLWIATADGGVSRFDSARFDTFGLKDGLPNLTVMAIAEDAEGRLLFGTFGGGIAAYDGCGFQVYTTEHGLPSNEILGLQAQPDGSILVLTGAGVAWFAEGRCIKCMDWHDGGHGLHRREPNPPGQDGGNRLGASGGWPGAGLEQWRCGQGVQVGGPNATSDRSVRRDPSRNNLRAMRRWARAYLGRYVQWPLRLDRGKSLYSSR